MKNDTSVKKCRNMQNKSKVFLFNVQAVFSCLCNSERQFSRTKTNTFINEGLINGSSWPLGLTYLARLSLLSQSREHKSRLNFRDSLNPICNYGNAIESVEHYLLHCSNFKNGRHSLLKNVGNINPNFLSINEDALTDLLLHGNNTLTDNTNTFLLNPVIEYITSTKRFNNPLIF